jgi:hypothetical protein
MPRGVVEFALSDPLGLGFAAGANRNAFLLQTAGELGLSVDDDTTCLLAPSPNATDAGEGVSFTSSEDGNDWWFFPSRKAALRFCPVQRGDLVTPHESLLGRSVANYAGRGLALTLAGSGETWALSRLTSGRGRVRATQMGIVGDCAQGTPQGYFYLCGESRERALKTEEQYRMARISREVVRVARKVIVTGEPRCMSYTIGMDNREMLPPFLPAGRNGKKQRNSKGEVKV